MSKTGKQDQKRALQEDPDCRAAIITFIIISLVEWGGEPLSLVKCDILHPSTPDQLIKHRSAPPPNRSLPCKTQLPADGDVGDEDASALADVEVVEAQAADGGLAVGDALVGRLLAGGAGQAQAAELVQRDALWQ